MNFLRMPLCHYRIRSSGCCFVHDLEDNLFCEGVFYEKYFMSTSLNGAKLFPNLKIWDTNAGEIDSPIEQLNNYVTETWLFHLNW